MKNQEADEDDLKAGIHGHPWSVLFRLIIWEQDCRSQMEGVKTVDNMPDEIHKK